MKMSKVESAIRVVLAFNKAFNRHDVVGMVQLLSNNCIFDTSAPAPDGTVYTGKEAITHYLHDFFHQSPQARIEIEDVSGFGHRCVMRWRCEWLNETGNKQHMRGIDIFNEKNNLICEKLSYVKGSYGN
jgi:predicted SnoaL-like aldol condensation-catalyzing enzyme